MAEFRGAPASNSARSVPHRSGSHCRWRIDKASSKHRTPTWRAWENVRQTDREESQLRCAQAADAADRAYTCLYPITRSQPQHGKAHRMPARYASKSTSRALPQPAPEPLQLPRRFGAMDDPVRTFQKFSRNTHSTGSANLRPDGRHRQTRPARTKNTDTYVRAAAAVARNIATRAWPIPA